MATQWRKYQRGTGIGQVLTMIERTVAESRLLIGDPINQAYCGLAYRCEYVDVLFRKAVRCLDALCDFLNADAAPGDLGPFAEQPLGDAGMTLARCGLRRGAAGAWEIDNLALEYALGLNAERVLATLEAFASTYLRPRLACSSAVA